MERTLTDQEVFLTIEVAPDSTATATFAFEGWRSFRPGLGWDVQEGKESAGVFGWHAEHDLNGSWSGVYEMGRNKTLVRVTAPEAGSMGAGPQSPEAVVYDAANEVLPPPLPPYTYELSSGHHHFVARAVSAMTEFRFEAAAKGGAGIALLDVAENTSYVDVRLYPNPGDWHTTAEARVGPSGAIVMAQDIPLPDLRNQFVLFAMGPSSSLSTEGVSTGFSCSSLFSASTGHMLFARSLPPDTYEFGVTMAHPLATVSLTTVRLPDHAPDPHLCW